MRRNSRVLPGIPVERGTAGCTSCVCFCTNLTFNLSFDVKDANVTIVCLRLL
jgi:hypothetical protein